MFEFFKRMKTIVNSELYALIEKAEDPIKMADQYLREMKAEIDEAERTTAKVMAEEKLAKRKVAELKALIEKRNTQALEALKEGKEELAKQAIQHKLDLGAELASMQNLQNQASQNVQLLQEKLREMSADYRELLIKRDALKTRALAAKAQTAINRSLQTDTRSPAKEGFLRMEEKVLEYEALAEVSEELKSNQLDIDREFKKMESDRLVEAELKALRDTLT